MEIQKELELNLVMTLIQVVEMVDLLLEPLNLITFVLVEQHHQKILEQHVMLGILQIAGRILELQFEEMVLELELNLVMIKIQIMETDVVQLDQLNQIMFVQVDLLQAKIHDQLVLLGILQILEKILV